MRTCELSMAIDLFYGIITQTLKSKIIITMEKLLKL